MLRQFLQTEKAKLDFKKRAILFTKLLKDGMSVEAKQEIRELNTKAACLEKNL